MSHGSQKSGAGDVGLHVGDAGSIPPEPFVTAERIAEHLKIARRQVLEMARKGLIPAHPVCFGSARKLWRFKLSEVDQAVQSGTRKPATSICQPRPATSNTISGGSPRSQKGKL